LLLAQQLRQRRGGVRKLHSVALNLLDERARAALLQQFDRASVLTALRLQQGEQTVRFVVVLAERDLALRIGD
jgi:hypothetical protein